ncbi:hypothetical protein OBV_34160 [Oscillibacter valericigenes Sjm18-20]|nr:hypothetical protein OBV_34160 [Oscillibacter valericigenes Sjm18-20]
MRRRIKKLPIVLPVLLMAVLLTTAGVRIYLNRSDEMTHTDLGEKYLNSMNYTNAAAEFITSLSENPTDADARLGLARAYLSMGETELVPEILQPLTDNQNSGAYRLLVDLNTQSGNTGQALLNAEKLANQTDADKDYALLDQLLGQVLEKPHSYAVGTDQTLYLSDGQLYAKGKNTLGQLGCSQSLGEEQTVDTAVSADFPGTASRVYCGGRTSYVVDMAGNLWAAGENRWGQLGISSATMSVAAGWTEIIESGDVASVAGLPGKMYVLRTDGSLWYAGQGGKMALTRVQAFRQVSALAADDTSVTVLSVDGKLYRSSGNYKEWKVVAKNVRQFSSYQGVLTWVTADNQVCTENYSMLLPGTWQEGKDGIIPDFTVMQLVADGQGLLLQGTDGAVRRLYQGTVTEDKNLTVTAMYIAGDCAVIETAQGVQCWDLSRSLPEAAQ